MQRVGVLVEVPRLLAEAGVDPQPVLRSAGIHPGLLADADGMLQYEQFSELLHLCVEATGRDDFDMIIGASGRSQHLGVLGTYMACGPNLGSAINDLVTNHPRYVRGGGPYLLDSGDGDVMVGYRAHSPGLRGASLISRGAVAFGYAIFRQISGVTPKAIHISLPPPTDLHGYELAFHCTPIHFNADHFGALFSRASLKTPNIKADGELRRHLANTIAARWAVHQPDVRERVMRALVPCVFSGTHSLESTARRINMTPEGLSRELKEQGASFRELLVAARLEMASQFLTDARMSITQIAQILGYSEISAFTRFFTTARGTSPAEFRRQHATAVQISPARPLSTEEHVDGSAKLC